MYPSIHTQTKTADTTAVVRSHDLRDVGLEAASRQLRAHVADLDVVFVARARSDLRKCPVCLVSHGA